LRVVNDLFANHDDSQIDGKFDQTASALTLSSKVMQSVAINNAMSINRCESVGFELKQV